MISKQSAWELKSLGDRWWLAAMLFLWIRAFVAIAEYPSLQADPDAYRALAEGWSESGIFGRASDEGVVTPTAYRPPLYPWLLSWLVGKNGLWLVGVASLHVLLGCLTSLLTWDIARQLTDVPWPGKQAVPWLAGLMVAWDPILLRQSSLLMTETAAAFMVVLIWWVWLRTSPAFDGGGLLSAACIGAMMGLSCLLRPSLLVWCPMLICVIAIQRWRVPNCEARSRSLGARELVMIAAMIAVLAPWAVRNRVVFGSTVWTTTHGGYTLLLANNPVLFQHFEREGGARRWDEERFHHLWSMRHHGDPREPKFWDASTENDGQAPPIIDEVSDDRLAAQSAWATMVRSPLLFAKACLIRIAWFWACWPAPGQASWILSLAIGGWYSGMLGLFAYGSMRGISGWWSLRLSTSEVYRWLPAISLVIGLTAVHAIYWSNMRMRAPFIPIVAVVAAATIASLCASRCSCAQTTGQGGSGTRS